MALIGRLRKRQLQWRIDVVGLDPHPPRLAVVLSHVDFDLSNARRSLLHPIEIE